MPAPSVGFWLIWYNGQFSRPQNVDNVKVHVFFGRKLLVSRRQAFAGKANEYEEETENRITFFGLWWS